MLRISLCSIFISLILFTPYSLFAQGRGEGDLRQRCRLAVGAKLLNYQNRIDVLSNLIKSWKEKDGILREMHERLKKEEAVLSKDLDKKAFDRSREERLVSVQNKLENVGFELNQIRSKSNEYEIELQGARAGIKFFRSKIISVFKIVNEPGRKPKGGYDFSVDFHHACGKYQYLCPLPQSHRQALQEIAKLLEEGQDCERYAQILPPSRK